MSLTFTIPYYASDSPTPLPTEAEIETAPDIAEAYIARRLVEVNSRFVVKFGKGVELLEGENMLFIREYTKIPVPRVYALYSKDGINYIVMERIPGRTLLSLWPELDANDKESITQSLRSHIDELRSLPSEGLYGSVGKRRLLDGVFWTKNPKVAINGPFTSEADFIEALALKYTYDGGPRYRADFYRQNLPTVLGGHHPIFTHGDFQRKNILVQKCSNDHKDSTPADQWKVWIIDWETAGWYPSYWEYCLAVCSLRWDDDWCLWLRTVLDPFSSQSAWLQALRLELWS